jgi:hypothetical protein
MSDVRARVIAAAAVACVVALMPIVNDLCARSCERPAEASCPQHSPRPASQCTHDHSAISADVPRVPSSSAGQRFATAAVPLFQADHDHDTSAFTRTFLQHSPPLTFSNPTPLRI